MTQPRILTFNFHEPYLCLMAKTGLRLDAGMYGAAPLRRDWAEHYRAKPDNVRLVPEHEWRADLEAGRYDVLIAHNESNALDVLQAPCPKLLVCHNRRSFLMDSASPIPGADPRELYAELLEQLREAFEFVFISESKRDDYGIPGRVILPGIDAEEYGGYTGDRAAVLRVGNTMRERDRMFDVDFQERAVEGLENLVVGDNPSIPGSQPARSFDHLKRLYREYRCLLHVSREEYEDGYNLVTLEALATGMPVVSLGNRTSPITDGVDGFVSYDADVLRERCAQLLGDPDLARSIGARGREMVARAFPIERFVENWRAAIFEAAERGGRRAGPRHAPAAKAGPNVLLHCMASPITTGRYIERALRQCCNLVSAGFRVPEAVLAHWGFEGSPPEYKPHDIDLPLNAEFKQVLEGMPEGFEPSLYLWIDSGPKEAPRGTGDSPLPKACYLIDTHVAPELRLRMAANFDVAFLAQKGQVELFRRAGIRRVYWMPLACSPELHALPEMDRHYDVSYVGSFSTEEDNRRRLLLEAVAERFPNGYIGMAWPHDMARIYAQSKIVVNVCVNADVNMRVFEAMAAGALLITDPAAGLEDLFTDREHLVVYRGRPELFDLIQYYLGHDEERARIAEQGRAEVLAKHTYRHRVDSMLRIADRLFGPGIQGRAPAFEPGDYYACPRPELLPHVPPHARRVLDVGCAAGAFGWHLKTRLDVDEVVGVEVVEEVGERARDVLDAVHLGNIETLDLPYADGYFDCIVCGDVLEHLIDPAAAVRRLKRVLAPDGVLVVSIPNAQFYAVVEMLAGGRWTYMDAGILDRTHMRFFTREELERLMAEAGLDVLRLAPLSMAGQDRCPRQPDGSLRLGQITIGRPDAAHYEALLTYQYLIVAGHPGGDRLAPARRALEEGRPSLALLQAEAAAGVDEAERLRLTAKAHARMGQTAQAAARLEKAHALRPDDPVVAGEYGIILVAASRPGDARPLLELGMSADPDNMRLRGALGLAYLAGGDHASAFAFLRVVLEGSFEHAALVGPFLAAAHGAQQLTAAAPVVRAYADFYPGNLDLSCVYARLLAAMGHADEAVERLETATAFSPDHEEARALLEALRRQSGGQG